jgi:hypothetical protein
VSVLPRQGYPSGGRSRITRTVTPQTTRNPRTMAAPNRMNTMGMTAASIPQASGVGVSVLGRKASGFQGGSLVVEHLPTDDLALAKRVDVDLALADVHTAGLAAPALVPKHDDPITGIDEPLGIKAKVFELISPLRNQSPDLIESAKGARRG